MATSRAAAAAAAEVLVASLPEFKLFSVSHTTRYHFVTKEHMLSKIIDGKCSNRINHKEDNSLTIADFMSNLELSAAQDGDDGQKGEEDDNEVGHMHDNDSDVEMWHDDVAQVNLWDPVLSLRGKSKKKGGDDDDNELILGTQRCGKVISFLPPKSSPGKQSLELVREDEQQWKQLHKRTIVGTLTRLPSSSIYFLSPSNKPFPQFACPVGTKNTVNGGGENPTSPSESGSGEEEFTGRRSKELHKRFERIVLMS
jgi:hypothetical protein